MRHNKEKQTTRSLKDAAASTCSFYGLSKTADGRIGPYKLVSTLGEGGFAVVYLAEQNQNLRRQVALKIIKPGMDTKQVIARFKAERETLALLDHPNIAQVYDAGTTDEGRPYFVMEHIKGVSITRYCNNHRLNLEDRLKLFLEVCEGIQHAHQKGIIHRDIKPSNVLVVTEGNKAIPKIIDFGIAKVLTQPLSEHTLFTEEGRLIGTPEYMSPEQAAMTAQDIDTRSDIYSLGVLLYELLSDTLPFDRETLEQGGISEIQRIIQEEDPPHPSMRLLKLGQEAEHVARNRHTDVTALAKCLRKELEWIPLKAMRKERAHRYRSVTELADDVQRYLDGAPLIAGPESTTYRLRKAIYKHRALVAGITAVLIVFTLGVAISTVLVMRLEEQAAVMNDLTAEVSRAGEEIKNLREMVQSLIGRSPTP